MDYIFNPVRPDYQDSTSSAYWQEADRYIDEYLLKQRFGGKGEEYGADNYLQDRE